MIYGLVPNDAIEESKDDAEPEIESPAKGNTSSARAKGISLAEASKKFKTCKANGKLDVKEDELLLKILSTMSAGKFGKARTPTKNEIESKKKRFA